MVQKWNLHFKWCKSDLFDIGYILVDVDVITREKFRGVWISEVSIDFERIFMSFQALIV